MHVGMWALSPDIGAAPFSGDMVATGIAPVAQPAGQRLRHPGRALVYFVCLQPDRSGGILRFVGRPDLITDERYVDPAGRFENRRN